MTRIFFGVVVLLFVVPLVAFGDFKGKQLPESIVEQDVMATKIGYEHFLEKYNLKPKEIDMLRVTQGMSFFRIQGFLGKPDHESVRKFDFGDIISATWYSNDPDNPESPTKSLSVNTEGNYVSFISYNGFSANDIASAKNIVKEATYLHNKYIRAKNCLAALQQEEWTYDNRVLIGKIVGWTGTKVLIRTEERIRPFDPKKFSKSDRINLSGYLKHHTGSNDENIKATITEK